jgi:replicative DNA helicase
MATDIIERGFLSCAINSIEAALAGASRAKVSDFTLPVYRRIFSAILDLLAEGKPVDPILVIQKSQKDRDDIWNLSSEISSTANWEYYLDRLVHDAKLRELKAAGVKLQEAVDVNEALNLLNAEIKDTHKRLIPPEDSSAKAAATDSLNDMDQRQLGKKTGIITPVPLLTTYTGGWPPGNLIIIAARPSIGKSAFGIATAVTGLAHGSAVIFFSVEMRKGEIMNRMIIGHSGVDAYRFGAGKLHNDEILRAQTAAGYFADTRLWLCDRSNIGVGDIYAFCKSKKESGNCDMIIIDYLQLLEPGGKKNNTRDRDMAEISRGLKILARDLNVPVIVLSQLNRDPERRGSKQPMLADLRDSGAIEQDADIVLMLYRAAYYGESYVNIGHEQISSLGIGEITIAKNRNGQTGKIYFTHNESLTKIGGWPSTEFEYQSFAQ